MEVLMRKVIMNLILFTAFLLLISSSLSAAKLEGKLNINTATKAELMLLPGIGADKAEKILKLKEEIKGFKNTHDLLKVKGLGKGLFAKIQPYIKTEGKSDIKLARAI